MGSKLARELRADVRLSEALAAARPEPGPLAELGEAIVEAADAGVELGEAEACKN